MNKYKLNRRQKLGLLMAQGFTIIIAATILSSTANAITIRLNQGGTFTDENGAVAVSGGTIQIIRGSPQAPANTGDFLNPGEVFLSLRAGVDPAAPAIPLTLDSGLIKRDEIGYAAGSVIGILDVTNGTTIYLRIWKTTPGNGNYYLNSGPITISWSAPPPPELPLGFTAGSVRFIAGPPPIPDPPTASNVRYDVATLSGTYPDRYQLSRARVQYREESEPDAAARTKAIGTGSPYAYTINEPVGGADALLPGRTYVARVGIGNNFVPGVEYLTSAWSASFTTRSAPGGAGDRTYDLRIALVDPAVNSVRLSWRSVGATAFDIYRSEDPNAVPGAWALINNDIAPVPDGAGIYSSGPIIAGDGNMYYRVVPGAAADLTTQPAEIVGKVTFSYQRPAGPGVSAAQPNAFTFSLPFIVLDPVDNTPVTARDVMAQIEAQNAVGVIDIGYVGFWNQETLRSAALIQSGGAFTPAGFTPVVPAEPDFTITRGQAYQVGIQSGRVDAPVRWTVVGRL